VVEKNFCARVYWYVTYGSGTARERVAKRRGKNKGVRDARSVVKGTAVFARKPTARSIVRRSWRPAGIFVSDGKRPRARVPLFLDEGSFPPVSGRICFIRRGSDRRARVSVLKIAPLSLPPRAKSSREPRVRASSASRPDSRRRGEASLA